MYFQVPMFSTSPRSGVQFFHLPQVSKAHRRPNIAASSISYSTSFLHQLPFSFTLTHSSGKFCPKTMMPARPVAGNPPPDTLSFTFRRLDGIQELAESGIYKVWFLDQFGVLHDGKQPYPGALSALRNLTSKGAKLVIISNSSRRSCVTIDKMKKLGFDPSLFLGAVTSGELTHQYLERRDDPWFSGLGRSCIHMTWSDRGAISLAGLDLNVVNNVCDAEFILAHGTEAIGLPSGDSLPTSLDDLENILVGCSRKDIPMVVANPDYVTVEAKDLRVMPGTLGAKYEDLGGKVIWMGKPDKVIYESAMALAGVDNPSHCIAVGDSLHHDIRGANKAGIESIFVTSGIHAKELGIQDYEVIPDLNAVQDLAKKYNAEPAYILPSFIW